MRSGPGSFQAPEKCKSWGTVLRGGTGQGTAERWAGRQDGAQVGDGRGAGGAPRAPSGVVTVSGPHSAACNAGLVPDRSHGVLAVTFRRAVWGCGICRSSYLVTPWPSAGVSGTQTGGARHQVNTGFKSQVSPLERSGLC